MITVFDDVSFVQAMLDFERALSAAEAENGVIADEAAEIIGSCCDVLNFDLARISDEAVQHGTIVIPLVRQLTQLVAGKNKSVSGWVHFGATSQDVIDTAMILQLKKAFRLMKTDILRLDAGLKSLAEKNEKTVMIGRTLMQPAVPITFGQKVKGWRSAILRSWRRIENASAETFLL